MKISIITAAFNNEKTIRDTIESVSMQTYPDLEHIIVDGASKDSTVQIIESLKHPRLRYISEKDRGIYDALNKGIKLCTGDVVGIIGADDYYPHAQVIERVVQCFEKNNTDSLYGDMQYINYQDKIVRFWKGGVYNPKKFLLGWMPHHLTFYLKKDVMDMYGMYREDFRIAGDYEFMLRILYKHKITTQYLPEVLVTMRTGGASTKNIRNRLKANMEDRKAWDVNDLKPKFYTLLFKPLLKVPQFFKKEA